MKKSVNVTKLHHVDTSSILTLHSLVAYSFTCEFKVTNK